MAKKPPGKWRCPHCSGKLVVEVEGVVHYKVDPRTGLIGIRPFLYDGWNPASTPMLYCRPCMRSYDVFMTESRVVVEIGSERE